MLARHALTDAEWERIEHLLPGRPGQTGWLAKDNRLFLDAVLYVGRTGIPWRDLPHHQPGKLSLLDFSRRENTDGLSSGAVPGV